jgi:hypothetical protein
MRDIAEAFADDRFARNKALAESGSGMQAAREAVLERYREGWLPARLMKRLSERYFRSLVG